MRKKTSLKVLCDAVAKTRARPRPRIFHSLWPLLVFTVGASIATQGSGSVSVRAETPIRSIGQIRGLKADAPGQGPEIHVHAVVTYYDTVAPNLFVQDATGGIWVDLRGNTSEAPRPGQALDLHGYAAFGFTPYIAKPQWTVVGSSPPPKPIHLDYQPASTGSFDGEWVEIDGVVRSFVQQKEGDMLVIDVATPTGTFKVRVPGYQEPFPMQLIDSKVRFRGVCGTAFNRHNQLIAIHIFMPSLADSEILDPGPKDPFVVPATAIGNVGRFSSNPTDLRRVKVVGTATAIFPQRGLFVMDASGGLYAESQDGTPAEPGDEVEVIGFPAAGAYSPILKSARFRRTGKHASIAATSVTGRAALKGDFDGQLVNISGTVRGYRQHLDQYTPVVESDDHVAFEASLRQAPRSEWLGAIGSNVALTGVCSVRTDENGNPSEFQIVLRTPVDARVLASPPWVNLRRAVLLLFCLAVLTLGIVAWVLVLRRRVRQQTELIRLKLENEVALEERYRSIFERNLTGLYIAQQDGTVIDCNESCAHILGFSSRKDLLANRAQAGQITKQFCNGHAQTYIANAEHRFQRRDGSWGWVLSNARRVPSKSDSGSVIEGGLVDITDRKTAEEQIQFLAYYDSLTGLANRTLLQDRLSKAVATAKRHKERVAVLFLDLDRFKNINDSLGHSFGDQLLAELALRLQACAREQDTVARLGGDEFIVGAGFYQGSGGRGRGRRTARPYG
jgi:PAS domain S-box-containing protein